MSEIFAAAMSLTFIINAIRHYPLDSTDELMKAVNELGMPSPVATLLVAQPADLTTGQANQLLEFLEEADNGDPGKINRFMTNHGQDPIYDVPEATESPTVNPNPGDGFEEGADLSAGDAAESTQ